MVRFGYFLTWVKVEGFFSYIKKLKTCENRLYRGDNSFCYVLGTGSDWVQLKNGDNLVLTNILLAPNIRRNLMSIPQLDKKGFETSFISGKATVVVNKNILVFGIYLMGCTN